MIHNTIETVIGNFPLIYKAMLDEISTVRLVGKDCNILEQGKYCNHLWFINEGAVKAFEIIEGKEQVSHFFLKNMFFTNYYCWVTKNTSDITFRTVAASEVIEIDYPKLEILCTQHHIFDTIGRKMAEKIFVQEYLTKRLLINFTATERYEYLEKEKPEIFQHFALKDIASFIGITDVSLSRIRKERRGK
jgi:CRP-like cAMP-binding protein